MFNFMIRDVMMNNMKLNQTVALLVVTKKNFQ